MEEVSGLGIITSILNAYTKWQDYEISLHIDLH